MYNILSKILFQVEIKMTNKPINQTTLYCQKGSSDKVYHLQIDSVAGGFMVMFANAKRGAALKIQAKTPEPVTLEDATAIYNKIIKEKTNPRKGYTESLDEGVTLQASSSANQESGIEVQLLNEINESEALALCDNPEWVAQEKHDGERRPIQVKDGVVNGINRNGLYCGLVSEIADGVNTDIQMVVDGEDLRKYVAVFDLLEYDGKNLRNKGFLERYKKLSEIVVNHPSLVLSKVAITSTEKHDLIKKVKAENREGVVFKKANSPYVPSRPNKGGEQLKFKLYDEVSVIVAKINQKRSVLMTVIDDAGNSIEIGNVTIPQNSEIPKVGDVIEVRYMYAYPKGSLFQPVFNKFRNDIAPSECLHSRLKYKRTE